MATGRKAVPVRPISGLVEAMIETTENELRSLLSHIHPKPVYHLLQDKIDDRFYIIIAVEPRRLQGQRLKMALRMALRHHCPRTTLPS